MENTLVQAAATVITCELLQDSHMCDTKWFILITNFSFLVDDGSMCWKLLEETGLVGRLEEGLAAEPVEWKRSFGRTAKSVTVRAKLAQSADHFRALQDQAVPTKLIGHPVLHTFWTDCQDLDAYKSGVAGSVKDEISR